MLRIAAALFFLIHSFVPAVADDEFVWPEGKTCAVSFSIDDGFWNSCNEMAEIFDRHGLKGTFNLVTHWVEPMQVDKIGDSYNEGLYHGSWPQWKTLLDRGHEIGSHTLTHPALPTIPLEDARREIVESKAILCEKLGIEEPFTFGFPYNQPSPEVLEIVSEHYLAARVGGKIFNETPAALDMHQVQSWWPYSDTPLDEILAKIDEARQKGCWLVIGLHGMNDEGWHPITPEKFEAVCEYLAADDEIWTATFKEVALWLNKKKQK